MQAGLIVAFDISSHHGDIHKGKGVVPVGGQFCKNFQIVLTSRYSCCSDCPIAQILPKKNGYSEFENSRYGTYLFDLGVTDINRVTLDNDETLVQYNIMKALQEHLYVG